MSTLQYLYLQEVDAETFGLYFLDARESSSKVADATSVFDADLESVDTRYFYDTAVRAGFAVRKDGELVFVHSLTRGLGDALVDCARNRGANRLDCFDGYLVDLYGRHGFVEVDRQPNYVAGGPDVVWMTAS